MAWQVPGWLLLLRQLFEVGECDEHNSLATTARRLPSSLAVLFGAHRVLSLVAFGEGELCAIGHCSTFRLAILLAKSEK